MFKKTTFLTKNTFVHGGSVLKTHGAKGAMLISSPFDLSEVLFLFFILDGNYIPFRLTSYKESSNQLVTLEGISLEDAKLFTQKDFFLPCKDVEDQEGSAKGPTLIGYKVSCNTAGYLGTILSIDDQTLNILFEIERPNGETILIPAAPDLIDRIDHTNRQILMFLPEGLIV